MNKKIGFASGLIFSSVGTLINSGTVVFAEGDEDYSFLFCKDFNEDLDSYKYDMYIKSKSSKISKELEKLINDEYRLTGIIHGERQKLKNGGFYICATGKRYDDPFYSEEETKKELISRYKAREVIREKIAVYLAKNENILVEKGSVQSNSASTENGSIEKESGFAFFVRFIAFSFRRLIGLEEKEAVFGRDKVNCSQEKKEVRNSLMSLVKLFLSYVRSESNKGDQQPVPLISDNTVKVCDDVE